MIATCRTCGRLFDTTQEDAYTPGGTQCPPCHWRERGEPMPAYVAAKYEDATQDATQEKQEDSEL